MSDIRNLLDDFRQDALYALRALARHPGFTTVAVVTLALGIGANTAIFSVVQGVLLKPLPYKDSARIVTLFANIPASESRSGTPSRGSGSVNVPELTALRSRVTTLSSMAFTSGPALMTMIGRGEATPMQGISMAPGVFDVLGVAPVLGRTMGREDERVGADGVIVLSYALWQRHFGSSTDIVGQTLMLANSLSGPGQAAPKAFTVIGVMPETFQFPGAQVQFWIPNWTPRSGGSMIARLVDGVSPEAAAAEVGGVLRELRPDRRQTTYGFVRTQDNLVEPVRPALRILMTAVGFVLLIACANVANLLLARASVRRREMAIRIALGAGRARVIRQLLTESLLLALLGGAAGTWLAFGGIRLLRALATTYARMDLGVSQAFPRLDEITLDASVLAFTLGISLIAGIVLGLAPALQLARRNQIDVLRDGASATASGFGLFRRHRLRGVLVIAEIALAMMLLTGGGLLIRSFITLSRVDPGYDSARLMTFQVALPSTRYTAGRMRDFAETMTAKLRAMPGVEAAAYARQLPMVQLFDSYAVGRAPNPDRSQPPDARLVSHDYLQVMGMHVIAGRAFNDSDDRGSPRVMIINQALAHRDFPNEDPVGRLVYAVDAIPWLIVGVIDDVRQFGLDRAPTPQFFADVRQWSEDRNLFPLGPYYIIRTAPGAASASIISAIRGIAQQMDAESGLYNVASMDAIVSNSTSRPRMYATLLGIFAGVSACLAAIGLYGVMAYGVAQRTREIAIRMALGARRANVMRLVLGQSLALAAIGIAIGIAGAAGVTRYLQAMLFGLTPFDTTTFVGVAIMFATVALIASYVPARRATRVDPLIALRYD
jgi:predicted permease